MESRAKVLRFPLEEYRRAGVTPRPTRVSQPVELASYSIDSAGRRTAPGHVRRFKGTDLPLPLDLSVDVRSADGFIPEEIPLSKFVPKDHDLDTISRLTDTIEECAIDTSKFHIITFRYNLNRIMETVYNKRDAWEIGIRVGEDIIHFDARVRIDPAADNSQSKYVYWGYKFEDAVTEGTSSSTSCPVDPNVEYCTVTGVTLGQHRLLVGAEIDCFEGDAGASATRPVSSPPAGDGPTVGSKRRLEEPSLPDNVPAKKMRNSVPPRRTYVELKTSRLIESSRQYYNFRRFKLLRYWIQSFIVGVPYIVVGYRDDKGSVHSMERLRVNELPRQCEDVWNAFMCLAFADNLLSFVRNNVTPNRTYNLTYSHPFNNVELKEVRAPSSPTCPENPST